MATALGAWKDFISNSEGVQAAAVRPSQVSAEPFESKSSSERGSAVSVDSDISLYPLGLINFDDFLFTALGVMHDYRLQISRNLPFNSLSPN
jgi:hypothetical protein